jgi:predicted RNase H-like HicB family nuclease
MRYIGLVHKDPDSDYGVSYPDLPGLAAGGATLDEAQAAAEHALPFHLDGMRKGGEAIPQPTLLHAVQLHDQGSLVAVFFTHAA